MIRRAEVNDASRLAEILIFAKRTAYRQIFNNDDGIVKGLIKWGISDKKEIENSIEIFELYIDTFFQGQGIGSILIKDCIEYAKKQSIRKIFLWVLEKNHNARKIYKKHGFKPDNISKFEEGTTETLLRYKLEM